MILKSKLNGRNQVTAINTWAVAIFRYGAGIIQWKASELKDLDRKSRKAMNMYGGLHMKSDVDRFYVKRKEVGRSLISVERCIREEENSSGFYVANSKENLIRGVLAAETINTRETITSVEFNKKQKAKELKEKWSEKRIHGQFIRETTEKVDKEKKWQWLSRGDLKVGTEALLCAAQEQAIRKNYIKYHIDKTSGSPLCRLCGKKGESVQHITSGCEKLAQKKYKRRHNNVAKQVHWDICEKNGLEHSEKWYEHAPEGAVENEEIKVLWDINIQCGNLIEARRPDLIVIDKKEQKGIIIDIAVPADVRVEEKGKENVEKYKDLKREISRLWKLRNVEIVPVVIGALGSISAEFGRWMGKLGITCNVGVMQKTAVLGTARILRKVLEM